MLRDIKTVLNRRALIRGTIYALKEKPIVRACYRTCARIFVWFEDGNKELWSLLPESISAFSYKLPDNPFEGPEIQITYQYLYNPLDENSEQMKKLFFLGYKQWKVGSFVERRLSIHRLIKQILDEGWLDIQYHHKDLVEDLEKMNSSDLHRKHMWDNILHIYGRYGIYQPGRMIVEQFTPWNQEGRCSIQDAWKMPKILYYAVRNTLRKKRDVTRHSLLLEINRLRTSNRFGIKYVSPNVYRTIYKCFNLKGKMIADPYPDIGSKAIAATIEGCEYHSNDNLNDLAKFLGTEYYKLDRKSYDCAILDYSWRDVGDKIHEDLEEWRNHADMVLVYVPRAMARYMARPDKYLKVATSFWEFKKPDFIFCYL